MLSFKLGEGEDHVCTFFAVSFDDGVNEGNKVDAVSFVKDGDHANVYNCDFHALRALPDFLPDFGKFLTPFFVYLFHCFAFQTILD